MSLAPVVSVAVLGFILGLQHATDPDHLVAVATIVTRERRFRDGALVGALWGLGHTLTLTAVGTLIVALNLTLQPAMGIGLELLVALMLVVLGTLRLRDAFGGFDAHPHVHPSRRFLAAWRIGGRALGTRAMLVGMIHGLAGSAAISLLVLATLHSVWSAALYLVIFGAGTIVGMTMLTVVMAYPVSLTLRLRRARRVLAVGTGAGSIAFGVVYALRLF